VRGKCRWRSSGFGSNLRREIVGRSGEISCRILAMIVGSVSGRGEQCAGGVGHRCLFYASGGDVDVGLGGGHVGVSEEALQFGYGSALFDKQRRVRVAQRVAERSFGWGDACSAEPASDDVVDHFCREWFTADADEQWVGVADLAEPVGAVGEVGVDDGDDFWGEGDGAGLVAFAGDVEFRDFGGGPADVSGA